MNTIDKNRILNVKGGFNFRDLGGIITKDGNQIVKDALIRTDELSNLLQEDLDLLARLKVQTVVDFRTDQEREAQLDKVPITCKNQIHLDIVSGNMNTYMAEIKKGTADLKKLMFDLYKDLVLDEHAIQQWIHFFSILQDPSNTAIIYHCTAGKDRTGMATVFILEALNVDRKTIEDDYLLSNDFLKDKYSAYIQQNPMFADLFLVQADYLKEAYSAIEQKYDSVQNYLKSVLKVDVDLLRKLYTKPV